MSQAERSQPPAIVRYREPKPRFTNTVNTDEFGLKIPSRQVVNYEPGINENAPLFDVASGFNYRVEAKRKMKQTWATYLAQREKAKATAVSENKKKNTTSKKLFGGRRSTRRSTRNKSRCY